MVEKKREAKAKKDGNLRKELNKEFRRAVRRDMKEYYKICKDTENENIDGKI